MNISRLLMGALILCASPTLSQPDVTPPNGLPYRLVSPSEAIYLALPQKPISLHIEKATLQDALQEIAKQSDITLTPSSFSTYPPDKTWPVHIETPFFEDALTSLGKAMEMRFILERTLIGRRWNLYSDSVSTTNIPRASPSGFSLALLTVTSSRSKTAAVGSLPESNFDLTFECHTDPRLPVWGSPEIRLTRAVDDTGQSLRQLADPTVFRRVFPANLNWDSEEFHVKLSPPRPQSKKLTIIDGKVLYVLPIQHEHWEVENVVSTETTFHDFLCSGQKIRIAISHASVKDNNLKLRIAITPANPVGKTADDFFPFTNLQLMQLVRFKDANGTELMPKNYDGRAASYSGKAIIQANFAIIPDSFRAFVPRPPSLKIKEPISLSLDLPTEFVQTEVPFSFSNIPLP